MLRILQRVPALAMSVASGAAVSVRAWRRGGSSR